MNRFIAKEQVAAADWPAFVAAAAGGGRVLKLGVLVPAEKLAGLPAYKGCCGNRKAKEEGVPVSPCANCGGDVDPAKVKATPAGIQAVLQDGF